MSVVEKREQSVQTLKLLGLGVCEARVYLALARSGVSTAKSVSQVSGVSRPDVYRIMPKLGELGLVEEVIAKPIMFKAMPVGEATSILLDRRIKETSRLQVAARELVKNLEENEANGSPQEDKQQFILIPKKRALKLRLKKAVETAQTSIDVVCSRQAFPLRLLIVVEYLKKALKRGVKTRWIVEQPTTYSWPKVLQALRKKSYFTLRTVPNPLNTRLAIYDKKEVIITSNPATAAAESPALWSNNRSFLAIMQDYFEILWLTAIQEDSEELAS